MDHFSFENFYFRPFIQNEYLEPDGEYEEDDGPGHHQAVEHEDEDEDGEKDVSSCLSLLLGVLKHHCADNLDILLRKFIILRRIGILIGSILFCKVLF